MKRRRALISAIVVMFVLLLSLSAQASSRKKGKASVKLNRSSLTLKLGSKTTANLKATVKGTSSKAKWSSSNSRVASVNSKGRVVAKRAGTATITVKAGKASAKCKVTVKKAKSSGKKSKGKTSKKTKNAKAHAAYKKALQGSFYMEKWGKTVVADYFFPFDMNGDGVDELLIGNDFEEAGTRTSFKLFAYSGGQVVYVDTLASTYNTGDLPWYPQTGVVKVSIQRGQVACSHYKLSGASLDLVAYQNDMAAISGMGSPTCKLNNTVVNASAYKAAVNKLEASTSVDLMKKVVSNTSSNRERFL